MINAVGASPVNTQPPAAMPPMSPASAMPQMTAGTPSGAGVSAPPAGRPKPGFSAKMLVGIVALLLVVVGSFAAFNLSQEKGVGDTRQQAAGDACTVSGCVSTAKPVCCSGSIQEYSSGCGQIPFKCTVPPPLPTKPPTACAGSGECVESDQKCCGDLVKKGAAACDSGKKCLPDNPVTPIPTLACVGQDVCFTDSQECCSGLVKVNAASCNQSTPKKCVPIGGSPVPTQACSGQDICISDNQNCCGSLVKVNAAGCPSDKPKKCISQGGTPVPTASTCAKENECIGPGKACCQGLVPGKNDQSCAANVACTTQAKADCAKNFKPYGSCTGCESFSYEPYNPLITGCNSANNQWTHNSWFCGSQKGYWQPNPKALLCNGCPWPLTNGACCPKSPDACPTVGVQQCFGDPWLATCTEWPNNAACPANQKNYWKYDETVAACGPDKTPTPTKKPGTNPTPTKPPVSTPTKPPVGPMCVSINLTDINGNIITGKGDAALKPGSQVKFMCGTGGKAAGVHHYEFQITAPGGVVSNLSAATGNLSDTAYTVAKTGEFTAKCRICTTATSCQAYE